MVEIARIAERQAKTIGDAITALPFPTPLAASRAAWQATATEQNAFLVRTARRSTAIGISRARRQRRRARDSRNAAHHLENQNTDARGHPPIFTAKLPITEEAEKQLDQETTHGGLLSVRQVFRSMQAQEQRHIGDADARRMADGSTCAAPDHRNFFRLDSGRTR